MPATWIPQIIDAKTANYTVTVADMGKILTNRGAAGSVTFTLPDATAVLSGHFVEVFVCAAQNVIVATNTTDTMLVDGDATADSIAWQTGSHQIGNGARFICDGTGWMVQLNAAATTTTIAAQTIVT